MVKNIEFTWSDEAKMYKLIVVIDGYIQYIKYFDNENKGVEQYNLLAGS